jgi:hypothetical protein
VPIAQNRQGDVTKGGTNDIQGTAFSFLLTVTFT